MSKVVRVIINLIVVFVMTVVMVFYLRGVIMSLGGHVNDLYVTYTFLAIILAFDVYNGIECIYLLYNMFNNDLMTGVKNQNWITRKGGVMSHFGTLYGQYTLMFVNIRDCKYINLKIGNHNGDILIRDYATQLNNYVKGKGYMGRMGGDNFLLILKKEYIEETKNLLRNIYIDAVDKNNEKVRLHVMARAGICEATEGMEYRNIINCSTAALTMAKRNNEDFVVYDKDMIDRFVKNMDVLDKYKNALMRGEFIPYYQPKVNLETGKLCGAEALARWKRDGELFPPADFIPALEADGAICELDYKLYEQVCADQKKWLDEGFEPVCVSVNFSRLHLENPDFVKEIIDIKDKYGVDSKYLEVELTESTGFEDYALLEAVAGQIKQAGFRISIDDFGTGYSSLSMLQKFEADAVKLDKSFIDSAFEGDNTEKSKRFLKDIIGIIRSQNEETICEGVETDEQIAFLKQAHGDVIQGFYFDKPLPKEKYEDRLKHKEYKVLGH